MLYSNVWSFCLLTSNVKVHSPAKMGDIFDSKSAESRCRCMAPSSSCCVTGNCDMQRSHRTLKLNELMSLMKFPTLV